MKSLLKVFILLSFILSFSHALTPFSLEGLKSVNVVVLNKGKLVSKKTIDKIEVDVKNALVKMGIKTETNEFSNFLVKIAAEKVGKEFAVNLALILVESVHPIRDKELVITAVTYQKSDFFVTDELEDEVYGTIVEYFMPLFEEQYKEEN